ncbi:hypothetical protein, partial [uncultured Arthrobacter sp.]|uniref:hypothetical protein n=1 Tax=uncultured Arthrobacter sp. TaxID=114050 RepID=UPI00321786BB
MSALTASLTAPPWSNACCSLAVGVSDNGYAPPGQSFRRSRISRIRRSAVFLPMPGRRVRLALSLFCTQRTKPSADTPDKIASASLAPTPLILIKARNKARSDSSIKPNNKCASSRTTRWVCR